MAGTMALSSINPATDQPIRVYEEASSEAVATALSGAAAAARWRRVPFSRQAEPSAVRGRSCASGAKTWSC